LPEHLVGAVREPPNQRACMRLPCLGFFLGFNGLLTFALEFEKKQGMLKKFIKLVHFSLFLGYTSLYL
jgi:hypothetical protein